MKKKIRYLLIFLVILLPSVVRILSINPHRMHGDDMIVAYLSAHYDLKNTNFFSAIPSNITDWVCQFPTTFFFFQKIFFLIFGANLFTVPLSIIPYVLIISIFLFLTVKLLFDEKTGVIALFLYAFFSGSLYLETLGLMFTSSTAVFLIFFYLMIVHFKKTNTKLMIFTGFTSACCYLFYGSSYLALPALFIFFVLEMILKKPRLLILKNYLICFLFFALTISPFVIYMFREQNFYLFGRINQVNLLGGEWSSTAKVNRGPIDTFNIIKNSLDLSTRALYENGIGGYGGTNFGNLALFDKFTLTLIILGLISSLWLLFKKKWAVIHVLLVVIVSFFTGMVLTIPPPAFHRFSIAFPFIIIIISSFFYLLSTLVTRRTFKMITIAILMAIFSVINYQYFLKEKAHENDVAEIKLAKYIHNRFPGRNLYIASFPGYNFEKIFYFIENDQKRKIKTDYHNNFLNTFNPQEKYLYVIIFPNEFYQKFKAKDPNGKIENFNSNFSLLYN